MEDRNISFIVRDVRDRKIDCVDYVYSHYYLVFQKRVIIVNFSKDDVYTNGVLENFSILAKNLDRVFEEF